MHSPIRNIAIIAHVDHGKTTLVDCLLRQSGTFASHEKMTSASWTRMTSSVNVHHDLAKNVRSEYGGTRINIVDTQPADFGGEVERVL